MKSEGVALRVRDGETEGNCMIYPERV